ncbi:unnamed protein product [Moneuplotes crassus]|uniref:Uncharacterized protein n=1 Tax=Euplotes crassus TaxID=5936 RepID=A0AAD2D364_EUPCR|nr:unnamed protein product [Moneuplotes crassus]
MEKSKKATRLSAYDAMVPQHRPDTPPETREHIEWTSRVLMDHQVTSLKAKQVLSSVKKTKRKMTHDIAEAEKVIAKWDNYNSNLKKACTSLNQRVVVAEKEDQDLKEKFYAEMIKRLHYRSPTKCSIVKRRPKFALSTKKTSKSFAN